MAILESNNRNYYADSGSHGDYRYISLVEVIDAFNATYVGQDKLCEKVSLPDITFHATRALQELSYDTLRSTKDWEVTVPSTLVLVMPSDFVNYVKLSWSDGNGVERILYPVRDTSNPLDISTTVNDSGGFTLTNELDKLTGDEDSDTWDAYGSLTSTDIGSIDSDEIDDEYGRLVGGRYGVDPEHAQANGSFFINQTSGKFHFSSNMSGKTVILKYISDGLITSNTNGTLDLDSTLVPKLAEEAVYKHILYGVLLARKDSNQALLSQIKKEKFAETRKAKLRLSNLKLGELTQVLRGSSKQIKH